MGAKGTAALGALGAAPLSHTSLSLSRRSPRGRYPRPRKPCCSSWPGPSSPSGCCGAGGAGRGDASPSRPPGAPRSSYRSRFCFSRSAASSGRSSRGVPGAARGGETRGGTDGSGVRALPGGTQPGSPPPRLKLPFQCGSGCVRCPAVCGGETPWGHRDSPTAPSLCHPAVPSLRAPNDAGALRAAQPVRGRGRCRPAPPVRFGSPARDTVVARCHRLQRDPTASGATS